MQPLPTGNFQAQMQHQPKIDSEFLNSATNTELKQVTEMFPWFQLAWLFYLKSLKKTGSPEFDVVLKKVAVIIANSKLVTSFINDETKENEHMYYIIETKNALPTLYVNNLIIMPVVEVDVKNPFFENYQFI